MYSLALFGAQQPVPRNLLWIRLAFLVAGFLVMGAADLLAQDAPPRAIGRVEGGDISVEGGALAGKDSVTIAPSVSVSNGSIVTVHSGQARLLLASGGEVDICGPAQMTLLQSGSSLTLAVNFGHLRIQLPASADLRVFTPTFVATPIDIGGAARDITVGLERDDSLCVLATAGALQLEHQFTGEKLIVPQLGEFSLSAGKLMPVASPAGGCRCIATPVQAQPQPLPSPTPTSPPVRLAAPPETTQLSPQSVAPPALLENQPLVGFSIPAQSNQDHPLAALPKNPATAQVPSAPVYMVVAPALTFSANSPVPPPDPTPDVVLLVREARVEPEYEFSGHVDPPAFAQALQHALGEGGTTSSQPAPEPARRKRGFWSRLKSIF
jgi:hypothetical protein